AVAMPPGSLEQALSDCCPTPCCPCPEVCGPPGRVWISGEFLLWWIKDSNLPPLVTAGPANGTGALGAPGTVILFGGGDVDNQERSGGRFTAGLWLNECQTKGVEVNFFFLGSRDVDFFASGTGDPGTRVIARPFFNVLRGVQDSQLVS